MIVVVDYRAGNLASVVRALAAVGQKAEITNDPKKIAQARGLILPGVGAFAAGMANLAAAGLLAPIREYIASGRPFLGICLGLHLLMEESEEGTPDNPRPKGLGIFPGRVRLLPSTVKVPQIGWNKLRVHRPHPYLGPLDGEYVYFVHSYYVEPDDPSLVVAETDYGLTFPAALGRKNILAVQFHPEKSGAVGLRLLAAFCEAISA
ncbi:MAG: imidazole glycerol phosphate synthase subunit HisH [Bacillota bacterium]